MTTNAWTPGVSSHGTGPTTPHRCPSSLSPTCGGSPRAEPICLGVDLREGRSTAQWFAIWRWMRYEDRDYAAAHLLTSSGTDGEYRGAHSRSMDVKTAFIGLGLLFAGLAQATTFSGVPQDIQSSPSPTTSGNTRMSISTGSATACAGTTYPGWYLYDLPSASVGSAWTATLLTAIAAGKGVTITGSGTCDSYGLEIVSAICIAP
jgi:hypothetical protein